MAERKRITAEPVYGSLAYDLDALVRERALEEAGRMEPEREQRHEPEVVQRPRQRQQAAVQPKAQVSPMLLASIVVLAVMVVGLLMGHVRLTELSTSVAEIKSELDTLNTEHVALLTKYEQTFEMASVKEAAEAAGMSKPSAGQIEYIELGGPDQAVVYAAGNDGVLDKVFASVESGVLSVLEYFS